MIRIWLWLATSFVLIASLFLVFSDDTGFTLAVLTLAVVCLLNAVMRLAREAANPQIDVHLTASASPLLTVANLDAKFASLADELRKGAM